MVRISEKDLKIVALLSKNARMPYTEIAKELRVTEAAVRKRIKKLMEEGIIKGFKAVVDPKKLGYEVVALVGFDTVPEKYVEVLEKVKRMKGVRTVYITAGDHMGMVEVWLKNGSELSKFTKDLENTEGVVKVCPAIIVEEQQL